MKNLKCIDCFNIITLTFHFCITYEPTSYFNKCSKINK